MTILTMMVPSSRHLLPARVDGGAAFVISLNSPLNMLLELTNSTISIDTSFVLYRWLLQYTVLPLLFIHISLLFCLINCITLLDSNHHNLRFYWVLESLVYFIEGRYSVKGDSSYIEKSVVMPSPNRVVYRKLLRLAAQQLTDGWRLKGTPQTPLQNGVGRYVCQLKRATIRFDKVNQPSTGIRQWIQGDLINYAKANPSVAIYLQPVKDSMPRCTFDRDCY